jgi:hypothetical protein
METVSSGEFTMHTNASGDFHVTEMLVHTDPGQDKPVILTTECGNYELRTYDPTSWQCVSKCALPEKPFCLYESDGEEYVHCEDGYLYHIVSVRPITISTSPLGHVSGVELYDCKSYLGPGRLVAVSEDSSLVHVIDLHGRQLADLTTCGEYRFTGPYSVVNAGGRVVVTGPGDGTCLGREWENMYRVVCVEESAGSWSVQWMHDGVFPRDPVIAPGGCTVIVPYRGPPDRIVSLSLETGAVVQQVDVAPGCPELGYSTCIYGESLLVTCGDIHIGGIVEFSLQGKMVCHHVVVVVVLSWK